jgi:hypothetical protein
MLWHAIKVLIMFDISSKLLKRVRITDSQCWEFTGAKDTAGYGIVWKDGANKPAHILSYEYHKGPTNGLCVLHTCDNPPCFNPEHLYLGTRKDNYDDMIDKGRGDNCHRRGEDNNTTVLTEEAVLEIYGLLSAGISHSTIAAMYGVARPTITSIKSGRNWNHLFREHYQ